MGCGKCVYQTPSELPLGAGQPTKGKSEDSRRPQLSARLEPEPGVTGEPAPGEMAAYRTPQQMKALNDRHAHIIKKLMRDFLIKDEPAQLMQPPAEGEEDDDDGGQWRNGRRVPIHRVRRRDGDQVGALLSLRDDESRKEIPMSQIMESADAQHNAVLKKPWYVRETSNRERTLAKFILDNVDELLSRVPARCRDFELLPEQRIAIIALTNAMPVETFTQCEIPREAMQEITGHRGRKQPFEIKYSIDAGMLPVFSIADYCTGSGKTVMAVMAALSLLCHRDGWTNLKAGYADLLRARVREKDSGLLRMDGIGEPKLARLAIIFVPGTMLTHWTRTAESAVFGVKETFGAHTDVLVWRGLHRQHSIRDAYDTGKSVLWILPMEADSMKAIRASPDIGYAVRIFDELNTRMKTRYDQPESTPLFNYITQATIESLVFATEGNPRHPMRLAFGDNYQPINTARQAMNGANYKFVQTALEHFCKMRQFAAPEFVRRLVAEGVQSNMPSGLVVQRVYLRAGTLSAIATGSDMIRITFPELAMQLLGMGVATHIKEQVKAIFSRAEVANSAEILEELEQTHDGMPLLSLADNAAKNAVGRLKDRMAEILGGRLPECPILMEPIPKERVRILKCCTCVIDASVIDQCKGVCPLCRAPITQMGAMPDEPPPDADEEPAEGMSDKAAGKRKAVSGASGGKQQKLNADPVDSDSDDMDVDMGPREENGAVEEQAAKQQAFDDEIAALSSARPYSVDGILGIMKAQTALNPSSRMLLCFGFEGHQRHVVSQILDRIRREIRHVNLTDIDACLRNHRLMDDAKVKFDDSERFPYPQVFVINTTDTSSSVQGLDLHNTDLTIVADHCSLPTQRQAAGRSLRMRPRPAGMKRGELFPAKRLIVAQIGGWGAPPNPDAGNAGDAGDAGDAGVDDAAVHAVHQQALAEAQRQAAELFANMAAERAEAPPDADGADTDSDSD